MRIIDIILQKLGLIRISKLEAEENMCGMEGCCGEACEDCPCQNGQPCLRDNDQPCGESCECEDVECECFEAGVCCKQKVK